MLTLLASVVLSVPPQPLEGVDDHPLVSRYEGSILQNAAIENYANLRLPTGPLTFDDKGTRWVVSKGVEVEGALYAAHYVSPPERSALEVFRNYQQALEKSGFVKLYGCQLRECDSAIINEGYRGILFGPRKWSSGRVSPGGGGSPRELYYWSGKLTRNQREAYVVIWVAGADSLWNASTSAVVVVEPKPMETDKVVVSLDALKKGLESEGKVTLFGLFFDTGKSEVKPESRPQLDEMAKLLEKQPGLSAFIVGHTDNVGAFEANLSLSQRRAEAVVAALVKSYRIAPARLVAKGVANLSPIASNDAEIGRARNRRVELVAR